MLKLITAAESLAVTLDTVKQRLRIQHSDDDADLLLLIKAATKATEKRTNRTLQRSSWELQLEEWPSNSCIEIPAFPVRDVEEIAYVGAYTGTEGEQTLDSGDFKFYRTCDGGIVRLNADFEAPALADRPDAVRVRFTAGYDAPEESGSGDDADLFMPEDTQLLVLFLVALWYRNREPVKAGDQPYEVPNTFDLMCDLQRVYR
jgi:uncharacterized phiE125 gp8 family phage protein